MKAERFLELEKEYQEKRNALVREWALERRMKDIETLTQKDFDSFYAMLMLKVRKGIDTF